MGPQVITSHATALYRPAIIFIQEMLVNVSAILGSRADTKYIFIFLQSSSTSTCLTASGGTLQSGKVINGSGSGLSPVRHQAFTWINDGVFSIGHWA